jgi:hypothetical protein
MVPCTPGFGGAYYVPGLRGNDRGIWPEEEEEEEEEEKGPVEVYAGRRSDPYIYEEVFVCVSMCLYVGLWLFMYLSLSPWLSVSLCVWVWVWVGVGVGVGVC